MTSSFAGSMLLETDLSRRQPVSPRKRNVAEGWEDRQAGPGLQPLVLPARSWARSEWAGRARRSLKSAEGRDLLKVTQVVPHQPEASQERGCPDPREGSSEVLHCPLLSLQPTSVHKRVAVGLPGEQNHCLGTVTIPAHPLF